MTQDRYDKKDVERWKDNKRLSSEKSAHNKIEHSTVHKHSKINSSLSRSSSSSSTEYHSRHSRYDHNTLPLSHRRELSKNDKLKARRGRSSSSSVSSIQRCSRHQLKPSRIDEKQSVRKKTRSQSRSHSCSNRTHNKKRRTNHHHYTRNTSSSSNDSDSSSPCSSRISKNHIDKKDNQKKGSNKHRHHSKRSISRSNSRSNRHRSNSSSSDSESENSLSKLKRHKKQSSHHHHHHRHKKSKHSSKQDKQQDLSIKTWGKYGVLQECDLWVKRQEFQMWLMDIKKLQPEGLPSWEEKQLFKDYMEDYNTATLPHQKYYSLENWERMCAERAQSRSNAKAMNNPQPFGQSLFDDETSRRVELQKLRNIRREEDLLTALKDIKGDIEKVSAMRQQQFLKTQSNTLFRMGRVKEAQKIQDRLRPDDAAAS